MMGAPECSPMQLLLSLLLEDYVFTILVILSHSHSGVYNREFQNSPRLVLLLSSKLMFPMFLTDVSILELSTLLVTGFHTGLARAAAKPMDRKKNTQVKHRELPHVVKGQILAG